MIAANIIVDASAFAAVIFIEPGAQNVANRLHGQQMHAPLLLRFEMAHVCIKKIRAEPNQRDLILTQYAASLHLPVELADIDYREVLDLAERFNLSAYDASYLWLAREMSAELVTLDARLERAAKALQSSS